MPVIPYADYSKLDDEGKAIYKTVEGRRPNGLLEIDRMLLNAPNVADCWTTFLNKLRSGLSIDDGLREVVTCRVVAMNGTQYVFKRHGPQAVKAGIPQEVVDSLRVVSWGDEGFKINSSSGLKADYIEKLEAAVDYSSAVVKSAQVDEKYTDRLKKVFNNQEIMEIVAIAAVFNAQARFISSLQIHA